MAKRIKRSDEWYRNALQGKGETIGLRETARGFSSRDGFNLRDGLSPAQKRKVTIAHRELQELTAQQRYVYKPKNNSKGEKDRLRKAQQITQADTSTKWKVAFIPHNQKVLKSGKLSKPRITFGKRSVRIHEVGFNKVSIELDQENLVDNPQREILDAIKSEAPKAQRFTIQAGANEISTLSGKTDIVRRVINLMNVYDGKKPLPHGSGNVGDLAKHHKWDLWLKGLIAYEFPRMSVTKMSKAIDQAVNDFHDGNKELQKRRRAERERARYHAKKRR